MCTLKDSYGALIEICHRENDLYKIGTSYFMKSNIVANSTTISLNGMS
jgi:hypothetical protein